MKYIIVLLFWTTCNQTSVVIDKYTVRDSLLDMHTKGIIEVRKDTLFILASSEVKKVISLPKEIDFGSKKMKIVTEGTGYPKIELFSLIKRSADSTNLSIRFVAMNFPGKKYKGEIEFKVGKPRVTYENVHFVSEIN